MIHQLNCRHELFFQDEDLTREILLVGPQLVDVDILQANLFELATNSEGAAPYVILPEGMQEMAAAFDLPYVTYGDSPAAHVRRRGRLVETPLGSGVLIDVPDLETLGALAAGLVARVDLNSLIHALNRPQEEWLAA